MNLSVSVSNWIHECANYFQNDKLNHRSRVKHPFSNFHECSRNNKIPYNFEMLTTGNFVGFRAIVGPNCKWWKPSIIERIIEGLSQNRRFPYHLETLYALVCQLRNMETHATLISGAAFQHCHRSLSIMRHHCRSGWW